MEGDIHQYFDFDGGLGKQLLKLGHTDMSINNYILFKSDLIIALRWAFHGDISIVSPCISSHGSSAWLYGDMIKAMKIRTGIYIGKLLVKRDLGLCGYPLVMYR